MKNLFKSLRFLAVIAIVMTSCVELEELDMITKIIKEPVSIDVNFVPANLEECAYGGYKTKITIEGEDFLSPAICNGEPGESDTIFISSTDTIVVKQEIDISDLQITADINPISEYCNEWVFYIMGQEFFRKEVCNGIPGEDGQDGQDGVDGQNGQDGQDAEPYVPVFTTEKEWISETCWVRTVYLDGEIFYEDTICNGQDAEVVVQKDTVVIINNILCNLTPLPSIQETFDDPRNSPHYWELGYLFEEGIISMNQNGSPKGNGTIVLDKFGENWATFWTPKFSESAITAVELDVGSRSTWKIELFFLRANGSAILITGQVIEGKEDVVWYDNGTYGEPFTYYVALDKIKYTDVIRVGFVIHKYYPWEQLNRNYSFNGDNLRIARVKVTE
jgi:hypothetical protein